MFFLFKPTMRTAFLKKNPHKFQEISYSGIIPFVDVGKEDIHKHLQYEVSMPVYIGRITNQRKLPKCLPYENYKSELLNI